MFHEVMHVVLGHAAEGDFTDSERTPNNLREVEADFKHYGAAYCSGYIRHWFEGDIISEQSAQPIFRAEDELLHAGRVRCIRPNFRSKSSFGKYGK